MSTQPSNPPVPRMIRSLGEREANPGQLAKRFGGKRDVAMLLGVCPRTVNNLMDKGMPHLRVSARKIIFDLYEVECWMKHRFGISRLGREATP